MVLISGTPYTEVHKNEVHNKFRVGYGFSFCIQDTKAREIDIYIN